MPSLLPACLAFSWLLCPLSPLPPFPGGEGGAQKFISPGAEPPAPRRRAAYGTYRDSRTSALRRETCGSPQERRQTVAHRFASAARVQPRGCKGRSPLHKITLSLPLPAGKGVGGIGAKKQAKGGVGGRQRKQAPRRVPPTPAEPATLGARPPPGTTAAGIASAAGGSCPPPAKKLDNPPDSVLQ